MTQQDVEKWSGRSKPGMPLFNGPQDVRDAFLETMGFDFTGSYLDSAAWVPQTRVVIAWTTTARDRLKRGASWLCRQQGITISDRTGFAP